MHASAQAVRPLIRNISQVTPLGLLKTKKKVSAAPRRTSPDKERAPQKQCADKNLGTKFRQRGISLYLAILLPWVSVRFLHDFPGVHCRSR
jgi:hypothetical protein